MGRADDRLVSLGIASQRDAMKPPFYCPICDQKTLMVAKSDKVMNIFVVRCSKCGVEDEVQVKSHNYKEIDVLNFFIDRLRKEKKL